MMKKMLSEALDRFNPGSFSFVMATGIVSIAAFQQHWETTARILFFVNEVAYTSLIVLLTVWSARRPGLLLRDVSTPSRASAFFTITAATCILGSQFILLSGDFFAGLACWIAGSVFWAVLIYTFFTALIVKNEGNTGEGELNGAWLLSVVGTQALAISGTLITPHLIRWQEEALLEAACLHLTGIALYFILIILIVRRMIFVGLPAQEFTPHYWINMGAAAISTLAGAELILHAGSRSFLREALPALMWMTLLFWAVTTWWIPLIVILNVWRYGYKHFPIAYDVQHWSMVFPLGMYAACSFQLGNAMKLTPLIRISYYFVYLALAAWIITFIGMMNGFIRKSYLAIHSANINNS